MTYGYTASLETIYVVHHDFNGVVGVYTTRENAERALKNVDTRADYWIEEITLDAEIA